VLSIAAQAAYQLRYESTEYYSLVGSGPKCFQVLGLSPNLPQDPMYVKESRGKPLQPSFPKYHELFEEPHHWTITAEPRRTH
jgi:hypothetical protein